MHCERVLAISVSRVHTRPWASIGDAHGGKHEEAVLLERRAASLNIAHVHRPRLAIGWIHE